MLGNSRAASIQILCSCGSVFCSFDKVLTVNSFSQFFWVDLLDSISLESSSKEVFHLVSLLTISFINLTFVKFSINEGLIEVLRLVYSDRSSLATSLFLILRK